VILCPDFAPSLHPLCSLSRAGRPRVIAQIHQMRTLTQMEGRDESGDVQLGKCNNPKLRIDESSKLTFTQLRRSKYRG
jgi:hypothetical protein